MWFKKKNSTLGEHVKFTEYDYRPYVDELDLINSENFQRIVKKAANKRRQALKEKEANEKARQSK